MKTSQVWIVPIVAVVVVATGLVLNNTKRGEVKSPVLHAPVAPPRQLPRSPKNGRDIAWEASFENAMARAKATNGIVMVDFHATWCGPCKMMNEKTYSDQRVVAASRRFISVQVDVDKRQDVAGQYGITSLPTVMWIRSNGKPVAAVEGFVPPAEFAQMMQKAHKQSLVR